MTKEQLKQLLKDEYTEYCNLEAEQGENALSFSSWLEQFYSPEHE